MQESSFHCVCCMYHMLVHMVCCAIVIVCVYWNLFYGLHFVRQHPDCTRYMCLYLFTQVEQAVLNIIAYTYSNCP